MTNILKKSWPEILLIYSIVLLGAIKDKFAIFSFAPHELLVIILFIRVVLFKTKYFRLGKVDLIFFIFYLGVYIIPLIFNAFDYNSSVHQITENFILLKIWLVFKIVENYIRRFPGIADEKKINVIIYGLLNAAFISAVLGLMFFFGIIDKTFLFKTKDLDAIRLSTTVGGINTTGVFFSIMIVTEFYFSILKSGRITKFAIFRIILFLSNVMLSGSMTGMGVLAFASFIFFLQKSNVKSMLRLILFYFVFLTLISQIPWFSNITSGMEQRIEDKIVMNKYKKETILPENLYGRYLEWNILTQKIIKNKPFFGYGFKSKEYDGATETGFRDVRIVIPESYYMNVMIFGGLLGIGCFLLHLFLIWSSLYSIRRNENKLLIKYMLTILGMYVLAQVTQTTLQYSGLSEFYGIFLALTAILIYKNERIILSK